MQATLVNKNKFRRYLLFVLTRVYCIFSSDGDSCMKCLVDKITYSNTYNKNLQPGNERFTNELIELELNELNARLLWHLR